jgi:hypothetical protein
MGPLVRASLPSKCKWGRPEGRPHSHRRVVLSEERRLAPSVVAVRSPIEDRFPSGSVTGARTGIRFRLAVGPDPEILSCSARRFRDRTSIGLPPRTAASLWPKPPRCPLGERPDDRSMVACRRPSQAISLLLAEALCKTISKTARTVPPSRKTLRNLGTFKPLGLSVQWLSRPSDDLKVHLGTESRKHARPRFSTVPAFRCGHEWITQRFVAGLLDDR